MSKYKVGDKVVLTVTGMFGDVEYQYYALNKDFSVWEKTIDKYSEPLSTYTEPLEAKIRRQASEITRLLAENKKLKETKTEDIEHWCDVCTKQSVIEQARSDGAEAAWELAGKIALLENGYSNNKLKEIFGSIYLNDIFNLTYIAAAAKVAEWERAKEEVKVGDIVKIHEGNDNDLCVLCMSTDKKYYNAVDEYGAVYNMLTKEMITKTGRHIDIDGFLKQIGGE